MKGYQVEGVLEEKVSISREWIPREVIGVGKRQIQIQVINNK